MGQVYNLQINYLIIAMSANITNSMPFQALNDKLKINIAIGILQKTSMHWVLLKKENILPFTH